MSKYYYDPLRVAPAIPSPKPLPKRRPRDRYIHSTCGCWQCAYCDKIKRQRQRLADRIALWDLANGRPKPRLSNNRDEPTRASVGETQSK